MSVGRAFHERGAPELKVRSPTRRRVRGTNSSEFVAKRRLVWRWSVDLSIFAIFSKTGCLDTVPLCCQPLRPTNDTSTNYNCASSLHCWDSLRQLQKNHRQCRIQIKVPKTEHIAGDFCVYVVKFIITHSSPDAVVVDLKTSSIRRSVVTSKSNPI